MIGVLRHIWSKTFQKDLCGIGFLLQSVYNAKKVAPPFSEGLLFRGLECKTQGLDIPHMCRIWSVKYSAIILGKISKLVGYIVGLVFIGV